MQYTIEGSIWESGLVEETNIRTELELALQRIRNLESELNNQKRTNDTLRKTNSTIRSQRDSHHRNSTDLVAGLLNGIDRSEKIIIRKSGEVYIRDGKSERYSGTLIRNLTDILPLKSGKPIPEAFKVGFVSFREFKTKSRKWKNNEKKAQLKFWNMYTSLFQLLFQEEIDILIEENPELSVEFILENPKQYFLTNQALDEKTNYGDYYFFLLPDGSRAYFAMVAGNAIPVFILEKDGTMTHKPS